MSHIYVIGDIAGQFEALIRLLDKCPDPKEFIFLGDLVDRGPDSVDVVTLAKIGKHKGVSIVTLKGNHEDMMVDWVLNQDRYDTDIWLDNGGDKTLDSYTSQFEDGMGPALIAAKEDALWLETRDVVAEREVDGLKFRVAHTMKPNPEWPWYEEPEELWNRRYPVEIPGVIQIAGHNSHWMIRQFKNDQGVIYAMGIDDSRNARLTSVRLGDLQIFQEDY